MNIYIYIYLYIGSVVGLASVMTDAQTAFDNCALENCPIELSAPR
jgi:hypothetical protein